MAIVRKYKRTAEDAFIAVLQAHTDLTDEIASGQIRRWNDASIADNAGAYVLVMSSNGKADPGAEAQTERKQCFVNIRVMTYKATDTDGSTADDAFAAMQDKLADSALLADLIAAVSNTTFFAVMLDDDDSDDAGRWRWRQVTLDVRLKITPP